jgi:hypothetical protein
VGEDPKYFEPVKASDLETELATLRQSLSRSYKGREQELEIFLEDLRKKRQPFMVKE